MTQQFTRKETEMTSGSFSKNWLRPLSGQEITGSRIGIAALAAFIGLGSLLLANIVTTDYGFIPVGFGFHATAGTIFAGFTLAARDVVQDCLGRWAVLVVIVIGTLLSFLVASPAIAIASAAAYLFAELADFAVYTPIRARAMFGDRKWALAVVSSNVVGAFADTIIFLGLAFGALSIMPALAGQMVGKMWATLMYLVLGKLVAQFILPKLLPQLFHK